MTSRLLTTPAEVRLSILNQLLYNREGVHLKPQHAICVWSLCPCARLDAARSTHSPVYPAIVACCRQIYEEGMPVLRSNRLNFDVGICGLYVQNRQIFLPNGLRKLQINVKIGHNDYDEDLTDAQSMYDTIADVRAHGDFVDLRVDIRGAVGNPPIEPKNPWWLEDDYGGMFLPLLGLLRLQRVELTGNIPPPAYTDKLVEKMLGSTMIQDVPAMYHSLQTWLRKNIQSQCCSGCDYPWDGSLCTAQIAAFAMDIQGFCRCRKDVIKEFYQEYNFDRLEIYENDPEPERAKYDALTDDIREAQDYRRLLDVVREDSV